MVGFFFWWNAASCGRGNEGDLNPETLAIIEAHIERRAARTAR